MGIALAFLIKGNKVVAMAATWISNPLTYIPLYVLNYHIGRRLLIWKPKTSSADFAAILANGTDFGMMMRHGIGFATALLLGSCVTGLIMGTFAYLMGHRLSRKLKQYYRNRYRRQVAFRSYELKTVYDFSEIQEPKT